MSKAGVHEPDPIGGDVPIAGLVIADINERVEFGLRKYGTKLMAGNGRRSVWDAYQESLDLPMYFRQLIAEMEAIELTPNQLTYIADLLEYGDEDPELTAKVRGWSSFMQKIYDRESLSLVR